MDAVGLVVGIIPLIEMAVKVKDLLLDLRRSRTDVDEFLVEGQACLILLMQLRDRYQKLESDPHLLDEKRFQFAQCLLRRGGVIEQYSRTMSALVEILLKLKSSNPAGFPGLRTAFAWKRDKESIREKFERIERLKSFIWVAESQDHSDFSLSMSQILRDVRHNSSAALDTQQTQQQHELRVHVLDWIRKKALRNDLLQCDLQGRAHAGTGTWFTESPEFKSWVDGKDGHSRLFCPGHPGVGKTILTSIAMDHLRTTFPTHDHNTAVLYFRYKSKHEQDHKELLYSILWQFVSQKSQLSPSITALYEKSKKGEEFPNALPTIIDIIRSSHISFILLDAMDEFANEDNERSNFLKRIAELQLETTGKLRVMMTARPFVDLPHDVCIPIKPRREDLQSYLDARISRMSDLPDDDELRQRIVDEILAASGDMFLLAKLHADSFRDVFTIDEVEQELSGLSQAGEPLHRAYDAAIERIDNQSRGRVQIARKAIAWIVYSCRPLSPVELQHAIRVKPKCYEAPASTNIVGLNVILAVCSGLLTVDEEADVIRFVHYTAHEYFGQGTTAKWLAQAEVEIANSCLTYLQIPALYNAIKAWHEKLASTYNREFRYDQSIKLWPGEGWTEDALKKWPLFEYTRSYWGCHAQRSQSDVKELALSLLTNDDALSSYWIHDGEWFGLADSATGYIGESRERILLRKPLPIMIASRWGLEQVVDELLEKGYKCRSQLLVDETAVSYMDHPLLLAARGSFHKLVILLLEKGSISAPAYHQVLMTVYGQRENKLFGQLVKLCPFKEVIREVKDEHWWSACAGIGGNRGIIRTWKCGALQELPAAPSQQHLARHPSIDSY